MNISRCYSFQSSSIKKMNKKCLIQQVSQQKEQEKAASAAAFYVAGECLRLECWSPRDKMLKKLFLLCVLIKLNTRTKQPEVTDVREGNNSFWKISTGALLHCYYFLGFRRRVRQPVDSPMFNKNSREQHWGCHSQPDFPSLTSFNLCLFYSDVLFVIVVLRKINQTLKFPSFFYSVKSFSRFFFLFFF